MGCIGRDDFGTFLEEDARSFGINVVFQFHDTLPTGKIATIVTGKNRYIIEKKKVKHLNMNFLNLEL